MKRLLRLCAVAIGASLLLYLALSIVSALQQLELLPGDTAAHKLVIVGIYLLAALGGGMLGYLLYAPMQRAIAALERKLHTLPIATLLIAVAGMIVGLFMAFLLSNLAAMIPFGWLRISLSVLLYVVLGYGSLRLALRRRRELNLGTVLRRSFAGASAQDPFFAATKLLDGSVLADGRICELSKTGFLEGDLLVNEFLLQSLRAQSQAEDGAGIRARRALETLSRLQTERAHPVIISDMDYADLHDIQSKLLRMANECNATLLCADAALCKVAAAHNLHALNVNELGNALKPVVAPGDCLNVRILKAGREPAQGVAYLADGTMIVVENGHAHIGEELPILVTSSLQTAAGRMIFGRIQA